MHNLNEPNLKYIDSLKIEYNKISNKDQVDIILANPHLELVLPMELKQTFQQLLDVESLRFIYSFNDQNIKKMVELQ